MENVEQLFTVIIPTYNVEKYIGKCLDSLLFQSIQNHKVVIVDDGSKDRSGEIAKQYAKQYPEKFIYIYQKNAGQGAARNLGMQYVQTPYVLFLDSDDWLMPRSIENLSELIMKEQEAPDIIFMHPVVYDMSTSKFEKWSDNDRLSEIFTGNHIVIPRDKPEMFALEASCCRCVWNYDFLQSCNFKFPEGKKWEDVFPHFYLFYWARRCIMAKDAGFCYRINSGNQTTSLTSKARLDIIPVYAETFAYALENNWSTTEVAYIIDMFLIFSEWSLQSSTAEVRRELVCGLHKLCRLIPGEYYREYKHVLKPWRKKRVIWNILRYPIIYKLLKNRYTVDHGKKIYNRVKQFGGKRK